MSSPKSAGGVAMLAGLSAIADQYDVLFCDVWGVVHDGLKEYPAAGDALQRFRARGGTVILVTNAPVPRESVERFLAGRKVRRSAWDAIVSSGDVTRDILVARGGGGVLSIGPERDAGLFHQLPVAKGPVEAASVAVVTGLVHDDRETAEDYRDLLARMLARKLTLVCANPDRVVHVGDRLLPCAGQIADLYEAMGGEVVWAGKPYAPIYELALATAKTLRGGVVGKGRALMIGDSVRTDIAGANRFGVDALFIARGIHRASHNGQEEAQAVAALMAENGATAVGAMPLLAW